MEIRISAAVTDIEDVEPSRSEAAKAQTKDEHLAMVRHVRHFGPATVRLFDDHGNLMAAKEEEDFDAALDLYFDNDIVDHHRKKPN